jgi:hypothetical protein
MGEVAPSIESAAPPEVDESIWASEVDPTIDDNAIVEPVATNDTFNAEFEPEFAPEFEGETFGLSSEAQAMSPQDEQSDSVWAQSPGSVSTMVEETNAHDNWSDDSEAEHEDSVESLLAAAAIAETLAPSTTANGLSRRVRGAQMPDTGPAVDRTLGTDSDPDHVRQALGSLQRGVANAHAENNDNNSNDF